MKNDPMLISAEITYVTRQGVKTTCHFKNLYDLKQRAEYLRKVESDTMIYAPTDSGDTRFNYNAELEAIYKLLEEMAFN